MPDNLIDRQRQARLENLKKANGPKTAQGKARSAQTRPSMVCGPATEGDRSRSAPLGPRGASTFPRSLRWRTKSRRQLHSAPGGFGRGRQGLASYSGATLGDGGLLGFRLWNNGRSRRCPPALRRCQQSKPGRSRATVPRSSGVQRRSRGSLCLWVSQWGCWRKTLNGTDGNRAR
jgi:hypothetical protein